MMAQPVIQSSADPRVLQAQQESVPHLLERLGIQVGELTSDSRKAAAGSVFAAYPGESRDGRNFIAQAVAQRIDGVL